MASLFQINVPESPQGGRCVVSKPAPEKPATVVCDLFVSDGGLAGRPSVLGLSERAADSFGDLITLYLTLHTIGVHYTYSKVPLGTWLGQVLDLNRNHFDRFVHFAFGFLQAYPARELFLRAARAKGAWASFFAVTAVLSLSGLFEVIESWVAQIVSPELGQAYLGTQGDIWDAQKNMTLAIVGAILAIGLTRVLPKVLPSTFDPTL